MAYKARILCLVKVPALNIATKAAIELTVQTQLTSVSSLCGQLSDYLGSFTGRSHTFNVLELRWKGSACDPANSLQLYIEHGSSATEKKPTIARFTATVTAVPNASKCLLRVLDKTSNSSGATLLNVGSPYITVNNLRQQLLTAVPGLKSFEGLAIYYEGEKLSDGNKLLSEYCLRDTDMHHNIIINKEGTTRSAVAFADISRAEALKKIEFSDSAPEWRIVYEGLNIEGRCKNMLCKAYNQIVVDSSHGLHNPCHHFDLLQQEESCPCPICKDPIEVDTCGFYDCEWMYSGIKTVDGGIRHKMGDWKVAGDKYELFNGAKAGNRAEWESLMILTRPRPTPQPHTICSVCEEPVLGNGSLNGEGRSLSCGHSVHLACLASASDGSTTCPTCNTSSPDPSLARSVAAAAEQLRPEAVLIPMLENLKAALDPC